MSKQIEVGNAGAGQSTGLALERVAQALEQAQKLGCGEAEARISSGAGLCVRLRMGEVESVEHQRETRCKVTVYQGRRKGMATTSDIRPQAVDQAVQAAAMLARHAAVDDCAGLADAVLMPRTTLPDLGLEHGWDLDARRAIELAGEIESCALESNARIINSEGSQVQTLHSELAYGNTHGFTGRWAHSRHGMECSVIAGGENGEMQQAGWYEHVRDPADLSTPRALGTRAAARAVARLGARPVKTCRAAVLFEAPAATQLFTNLVRALLGTNLYRRSSFLAGCLHQQLFPERVCIREEPLLQKGMGSAPFDEEGVATRTKEVIADGCLASYLLDSYAARKLGLASTANAGGVYNLTVQPDAGRPSCEDLVRDMGEGLLVTDLMGFGTNLVTGSYSQGAAGFWVAGGAIRHPVREVTIAGDLRQMFQELGAIGGDLDVRGKIRTGSVLVGGMTIAGK